MVKPTLWKVWMMKMISEELFPELALRYLKKPVVLLRRYEVILALMIYIKAAKLIFNEKSNDQLTSIF